MLSHLVVNIIVLENKAVLLERKQNGFWKLPGGHVLSNENPIEAAIREMHEELGLAIDIISEPELFNEGPKAYSLPTPFASFIHTVDKDSNLKQVHNNIGLVYVAKPLDEPNPKEGQIIRWLTDGELKKEKIITPVCALSRKALSIYC